MRERTRQAARQLNYRMNASARNLKILRTNAIGLLVTEVMNPFNLETNNRPAPYCIKFDGGIRVDFSESDIEYYIFAV